MNPADESSQRLNYMQTEQSERHHKSSSMLISSEKHHESSLKQFQSTSTQNSSSSSISVEDKLLIKIAKLNEDLYITKDFK